MITSRSHYYEEGEQREILLAVFAHFCRFSEGALCRKSPISTGRNNRLKPQSWPKVIGRLIRISIFASKRPPFPHVNVVVRD